MRKTKCSAAFMALRLKRGLSWKSIWPAWKRQKSGRWKERPASMDKAVLVGVASQAERVFSGIPLRADEGEAKRLLLPEGYASDPIAALDKGILYMTSLVSDE